MVGFVLAVILGYFAMFNDPNDKYGVNEYMSQPPETKELETPYGYQKTIKRQREQNPELYDAWMTVESVDLYLNNVNCITIQNMLNVSKSK